MFQIVSEVKVQFPEDISTAPNPGMSLAARRHPTWSQELHMMERRPRSRSLSVSRSTQTREELEHIREMKKIKFTVDCADDDADMVREEINECTSDNAGGTTSNVLKVPNTDL